MRGRNQNKSRGGNSEGRGSGSRGKFSPNKSNKKRLKPNPRAKVDDSVRLNRYLANAGICSRREADKLIEAGVVEVNGKVVTELGTKVGPGDTVHYGGEKISTEKPVYILLNKPKDFITTSEDPQNRRTVLQLVNNACKERVFPVGRLDRHTTGVLLLTNDGKVTEKLTHPQNQIKKIYHVVLDKNLGSHDLAQIQEGVSVEGSVVHIDQISYQGESKKELGIETHSGRNQIIRKVFAELGYTVTKLDRVFFAGLTKKNVQRGKWRFLTEQEIQYLKMLS